MSTDSSTDVAWRSYHLLLASILIVGLMFPSSHVAATATASSIRTLAPHTMWTRFAQVMVRQAPNGTPLSSLDIDQAVLVNGSEEANGYTWLRVRLWRVLSGWIRSDLLAEAPVANPPPTGVPVAPRPQGPHGEMALKARGVTDGPARVRARADSGATLLRIMPPATAFAVSGWATDSEGLAWYHLRTPIRGWVSADHVNLSRSGTRASLAPVTGLGMWCTPAVLETVPMQVLVSAARANHITHLYVEVGGSGSGIWGKSILNRLLPVAHRAHLAVLAWVYPYLDDLPADVDLTVQAARYRTPSGERPDGVAADVEQNMVEPYVRAYSQIVRARLGSRVLMTIATYAPQSYWGATYPYRTVARSWDVVAPMAYWHTRQQAYSAAEAAAYVETAVTGIRKATGNSAVGIEVIGQMFDMYEDGFASPSAAEIRGALQGARASHALSIGFFEWNHATPAEWDALYADNPYQSSAIAARDASR